MGLENRERTKQLIIYICERLSNENGFGSTMLNKILYYIDNVNYLRTGSPISDLTYIKQNKGPTPTPSEFLGIRDQVLNIEERSFFGRIQKRPVPKYTSDISCFTADEISHIDEIIYFFKDKNATTVSNESHKELAWKIANTMESLPFYTYLLTEEDLTDEDIQWAEQSISGYEALRSN